MKLFQRLLNFYIMRAVDGDDGGAVDRGDAVVAGEVEAPAEAEAAAEEAPEESVDEQPRGEDGKFAKKDGPISIPKAEFDRRIEQSRLAKEAAEARAADLERQIQQQTQNADIKALKEQRAVISEKLETARMEGDKDRALELGRQVEAITEQIEDVKLANNTDRIRAEAREEVRMDLTIERLEAAYDILRPDSETFDQDVVDMVLATQRDLMARERLPASRALETAVTKVMSKVMPAATDDTKSTGLSAAKGSDRAKQQVAKNLDTTKRQPASMKEVGEDSDTRGQRAADPDVADMSFEEFSALPDATKARLRGDSI